MMSNFDAELDFNFDRTLFSILGEKFSNPPLKKILPWNLNAFRKYNFSINFLSKRISRTFYKKSAAGGEISQEPTIRVRSGPKQPADHLYISRDLSNLNFASKNEFNCSLAYRGRQKFWPKKFQKRLRQACAL